MTSETQKFSDDLTRLIDRRRSEVEATVEVVDNAGFAINDATRRIKSLCSAMDTFDETRRELFDRMSQSLQPLSRPLSPARRAELANQIGDELPRVLRRAAPGDQVPPPLPQGYHQNDPNFAHG